MTPEFTIHADGKPVVPGATYVLEVPAGTTPDLCLRLKDQFQKATGARCVVLAGARLALPADLEARIQHLEFKVGGRL